MREYATHKLLICPPHLHNAAALACEKLINSIQRFERCFLLLYVSSYEKKTGFGAEMRLPTWRWQSYCRCSKWPPLVATQVLGEVYHSLVDVLLWQLFQMVCKATFNSSIVLGFSWNLWYFSRVPCFFQHGTSDTIVQWVQIWRVWGSLIFLNEPGIVRLHPILRDCKGKGVSWLNLYKLVVSYGP